MCLAIPGKILKINQKKATADFNGVQKEIDVSLLDADVGDYVIVHAGFAIEKTDEEAALETYEYLKTIPDF